MTDAEEKPKRKSIRIEIDQKIRDLATRCRNSRCCLEEGALCRVVDNVADKVFFVEGEGGLTCSYCLSFGDARYCNCPVRQELHRRYKL